MLKGMKKHSHWISYDITFCDNTDCMRYEDCKRGAGRRMIPDKTPFSISLFKPKKNGECEHFIWVEE